MAPVTLMPHDDITGKFIIVARLEAVEGKADEVQRLLAAVRKYSLGDQEPLTLMYRTVRGAGPQRNLFTVIEEYSSREGITHHRTSQPYLALRNSGLIASSEVNFLEEFE